MEKEKNILAESLRAFKESRYPDASDREFAGILEEPVGSLWRWMESTDARLSTAVRVLEKLGWNFERARPEYDPLKDALAQMEVKGKKDEAVVKALQSKLAEKEEERIPVLGRVVAEESQVRFSTADTKPQARASYYDYVNGVRGLIPEEGPVYALRVGEEGNERRSLVFIRAIERTAEAKDGDVVVFRHTGADERVSYFLRRLERIRDDRDRDMFLLGLPLSGRGEMLRVRPEPGAVIGVAVAHFTLGTEGLARE